MKSDRFGTIRKKHNTSNLQKLDSINQDKNGIYIGCVEVENGNFTNRIPSQKISKV
jgi:hypothetical protein